MQNNIGYLQSCNYQGKHPTLIGIAPKCEQRLACANVGWAHCRLALHWSCASDGQTRNLHSANKHCILYNSGLPDIFWEKKTNHVQKKPNGIKKSQIVKNHEISTFSMCCHAFSKVVNKANSTVTDYARSYLKFIHFQCIISFLLLEV